MQQESGLKQRRSTNLAIDPTDVPRNTVTSVSSAVQTDFARVELPAALQGQKQEGLLAKAFFNLRRVFFLIGLFVGVWMTLSIVGLSPSLPTSSMPHIFDTTDGVTLAIARDFFSNFTTMYTSTEKEPPLEDFMIGTRLHNEEGINAYHPVFMLPGIVSTGLESWNTPPLKSHMNDGVKVECSANYFRKRIWGTMNMVQMLLLNKQCWMLMLRLDPETGLDDGKTGGKVRASQGLDSVDFLFPGYWVWNKVINNLAAIGYDNSELHTASYDWRLSFKNMEIRDKFFSRLQKSIEATVHNGRKVVIISHSMGSLVWLYFMNWVESPLGGNAGEYWVDDHLAAFINIAGSLLGVPKTMSSLLSGETRETALLNSFSTFVLERLLSKTERRDLFRNMGALPCMFPKGGNRVWGTVGEAAPDDPAYPFASPASSSMLTIRGARNLDLDVESSLEYLMSEIGSVYWANSHNTSFAISENDIIRSKTNPATWDNPLLASLPKTREGSKFSIYCTYGIGKRGERSYFYTAEKASTTGGTVSAFAGKNDEKIDVSGEVEEAPVDNEGISHSLNVTFHDPYNNVEHGVRLGEGDGTVPLLSLGYPCVAWRNSSLLNPSKIRIVTREYPDRPDPTLGRMLRNGPEASDHVDVLGNHQILEDILRVVSGNGHVLDDIFLSNIREIAERIPRY